MDITLFEWVLPTDLMGAMLEIIGLMEEGGCEGTERQ